MSKLKRGEWELFNPISLALSGGSLAIDDWESRGLLSVLRQHKKVVKTRQRAIILLAQSPYWDDRLQLEDTPTKFKRAARQLIANARYGSTG